MGDKGVYIYRTNMRSTFFCVTVLNKPAVYGNPNKIDFGDKPLAN